MNLLKNLSVFLIVFVTFHSSFSEELSEQLQPRTINCNEKNSDSKIILTCSGYSRIPSQADGNYSDFSKVRVLDMSNQNHLQKIQFNEFSAAGFSNLETIKLRNTNIRTVENGAFTDLHRLVEVDLSNNKIDSFDMQTFQSHSTLKILILKDNPIHQLVGTQFTMLPHLDKLDMSNCQLSKIPVNAFFNLENLKSLNLESNKLERLDWDVFNPQLHSLSHLELRNNSIICNCHLLFLSEFLMRQVKINISSVAAAVQCQGLNGVFANLSTVPRSELTCPPLITNLVPIKAESNSTSEEGEAIVFSEIGNDIGLECQVEGHPSPEIVFYKDGQSIASSRNLPRGGNNDDEHFEVVYQSTAINDLYNFKYTNFLNIRKLTPNDTGNYSCVSKNAAGKYTKTLLLKITGFADNTDAVFTGGRSSKTWLWILLGTLALLIIALLLVCFLIYRKKSNEKQQIYKNEMLEKFKNSEIVLDDSFSSSRKQNSTTTPLLTKEENQTQQSSMLPDITQGSVENELPSLSPRVFSPRPQSGDLRRQFFATQIQPQIDIPSRPGSAMSMVYYGSQQRPQQFRQFSGTLPTSTRFHENRLPSFPIRRPGSSQSLIYPEQFYHAPRPILTRQFSGPAYPNNTMRIPFRVDSRRLPSTSSEPPLDRGGRGYVTLPRTFPQPPFREDSGCGQSVSPTESNYSSFSYYSTTLPRQRTNSAGGVMNDAVGPRTTIDGGSNLSLNKIGADGRMDTLDSISQGITSPTFKGKVKSTRNRMGSSTTPSSLRDPGFFNFEPIQEVEGCEDLVAQLPSNTELDRLFPTLTKAKPQTSEPKFKKKKAPPITSLPQRSRKPIRTFEYSKLGGLKDYDFDESLDGDKPENSPPELPISPPPQNGPNKSSIENIIETVEGTEV